MATDAQALAALKRARSELLLSNPFYGPLAYKLTLCAGGPAQGKTLCTDGKTLWFDADFVCSLPFALLIAAIAHEVQHCMRGHAWRRDTREPQRWNYATDYVVNAGLEKDGFTLGKDWLRDARFDGMSEERVYTLLPDKRSGDKPGNEGPGEVIDAPPNEQDAMRVNWQVATIQAAQQAQAKGALPASAKDVLKQLTKPRVDRRAALRKFMQACLDKTDYTWTRPARKYVSHGLYLPSLYSEKLPPVVLFVDTSGSRYDESAKATALRELSSVVDDCKPEFVHVICGDTEVTSEKCFAPGDTLTVDFAGGGGTDFRPIFAHIDKLDFTPACVIGITDLYADFPSAPGYPVLWMATTDAPAPFGEILRVED